MSFAVHVLDQDNFTNAYDARFAVTSRASSFVSIAETLRSSAKASHQPRNCVALIINHAGASRGEGRTLN
ncbi:hypothetical protein [Bradyrhizobium lablabi]|jgi:hypothetical protein|uniref:hypothetical protein n=1 Tax=Bradyrhizobium lablabi TaxID=722472 RepID=UPI0009A7F8B9|nr:hypothetical protein [Bradyrhizobium lablabi]